MGNNLYNAISQEKIYHLSNILDNMSQSNDLVKADIDSVAVQISSMFLENAKECKMIHKPGKVMTSQKSNVSKKTTCLMEIPEKNTIKLKECIVI